MTALATSVSTAVGALIGGGIVVAGNYQTARLAFRRDEKEWTRRRADIRIDEQRAAIKDLQDEVAKYARAVSRTHHSDVIAARFGTPYGTSQVGTEIAEALRASADAVRRLESRVGDADMRRLSGELRTRGTDVTQSKSEGDALSHLAGMYQIAEQLDHRVGDVLDRL